MYDMVLKGYFKAVKYCQVYRNPLAASDAYNICAMRNILKYSF